MDQQAPREECVSDNGDANSMQSVDYMGSLSPPGKRRKLRD